MKDNKSEIIRVRLDSQLKNESEEVLSALQISIPEAVRMFLQQVVLRKGLPFDLKLTDVQTIQLTDQDWFNQRTGSNNIDDSVTFTRS